MDRVTLFLSVMLMAWLSGAAVLSDGQIALIVDCDALDPRSGASRRRKKRRAK